MSLGPTQISIYSNRRICRSVPRFPFSAGPVSTSHLGVAHVKSLSCLYEQLLLMLPFPSFSRLSEHWKVRFQPTLRAKNSLFCWPSRSLLCKAPIALCNECASEVHKAPLCASGAVGSVGSACQGWWPHSCGHWPRLPAPRGIRASTRGARATASFQQGVILTTRHL